MTGKMKLYIGLLVLGLAAIGSGVWMLAKSPPPPDIDIPEEPPAIYEQIDYIMGGESSYLYIYDDGGIIYIEEKGFRPPGARHTKTWKTGKLTPHQMDNLLTYFENSGLHELDEDYQFPGEPAERGGMYIGDMRFTISVNSGNLSKTVTATYYLTPPDMPPPLNEIYTKLKNIAENKTEEVYHEIIKSGVGSCWARLSMR